MDSYLLLLISYVIFVVLGYKKFELPIISPTMITLVSLTTVIALGYWYRHEMGTDLYFYTFIVIALGGVAILGTGYGVQRWAKLNWGDPTSIEYNFDSNRYPLVGIVKLPVRYKYISMYMIFFILFSLLCVFINTTGDSDVSRMTQYRNILLYPQQYYHTKTLIFINSQFYKIALILTYISAYVAIYNGVILDKPIFKGTGLIIIVGLFCIGSSIAMGARQPAIEIFIFMILTYLFFMVKEGYVNQIKRFLFKLIPVTIVSPFLYILYGILVGRQDGNNITLERIAELLAGGIYALNAHIWEPARTIYFGQSSFADVYDKLINFGLLPERARMAYHEFDKFGNTLSLFGRWYEDFGILGVIIMSIIVTALFSLAYEYLQRRSNDNIWTHVWTAIFLTELVSLVWAGYDDRIRALLAFSQFVIVGLIGLFIYVGYRVKIKQPKR
ncbi:oligosaccharide repeat unit polymerase [Veillonella nakazawae]|uniref:Oligosaccharide repeat unit polymerase n=1 Tax=Veillonella nakazawae TaxID=2682456 RepID=A0AB35HBB0_9FIRM|nr:O-antigen polymerase [Veillonella nakazawae]MCB8606312.1 oligosaccharide repeat unit polymerase [Veillonella nakazawae]